LSQNYGQNSLHFVEIDSYSYDNQTFNIDYNLKNLNNLHEILLYSPRSIDSKYEKILFIFYQLLKIYKFLHSINLNCIELKLSDIYVDANFLIRIKLPLQTMLNTYRSLNSKTAQNSTKLESLELLFEDRESSFTFYKIKDNLIDIYNSFRHLTFKELANITSAWSNNKISNFSYLLILNSLAGKVIDCPYNHPIFPWITDFETNKTNLRDLSMSKFRLNKGDAHLDMVYQVNLYNTGSNSAKPYHLTEFLSEITYFVYKSRITSKETLCNHVRRKWVPNEYPKSMNRMYYWTPEECIPEFFCDSEILHSIHDDLGDIEIPEWCNGSVDEFIRSHRQLLESDAVSENLSDWIDLTFGFKLRGDAAVENKNVCLPLIDDHQTMKTHGIVQLFSVPHPKRILNKYYHGRNPPKLVNISRVNQVSLQNDLKNDNFKFTSQIQMQDNETIRKNRSYTKLDPQSEQFNSQIHLPDDYNPLLLLEQVESELKFTNKNYHTLPDRKNNKDLVPSQYNSFEDFQNRDIRCLACLICEIILFKRLICLPRMNTIEERYEFICRTIIQEPHILTGPFMPFITSVLKPFNTQKDNRYNNKKSNNFFNDISLKYQVELVNIDTLLNTHLSIVPFKSYFETVYRFSEIFNKLNYIISEFDNLEQSYLRFELHQINRDDLMTKMSSKYFKLSSEFYSYANKISEYRAREDLLKTVGKQQQQDNDDASLSFSMSNSFINKTDTISNSEQNLITIEMLHDQKFIITSFYIQKLLVEMSDPKISQMATSIIFCSDSFELIMPYVLNLFEDPNTCIDSFLFLLNKLSVFISREDLTSRFLPIILHVLNAVDLVDTVSLNLTTDDDRLKFTKIFDFTFINELRIIFGLKVFLTEICPFLVEAISGFKDFDYENNNSISTIQNNKDNSNIITMNDEKERKTSTQNDEGGVIFDMECSNNNSNSNLNEVENRKIIPEIEQGDEQERGSVTSIPSISFSPSSFDANSSKYPFASHYSRSSSMQNRRQSDFQLFVQEKGEEEEENDETEEEVFDTSQLGENDNLSLNSTEQRFLNLDNSTIYSASFKKENNISQVAFKTFTRLVPILGPVLSCKYCCSDLLKMLAICYMNSKCLSLITTNDNPLNSIRPIEGDNFAFLILESLKVVTQVYGEQIIILQYFAHVSNIITACTNRMTNRLEASLLACIVLVNYFLNHLELNLLMDYLHYILNQIVMPTIKLYSNDKIKFPNCHTVRQVIAYKILDIIFLISLRIGPEQTRTELETIFKIFFDGFTAVWNSNITKPVDIVSETEAESPPTSGLNRKFKARASIASILRHKQSKSNATESTNRQYLTVTSDSDNLNDESMNELDIDDFYKFSYDQTTNELTGSTVRTLSTLSTISTSGKLNANTVSPTSNSGNNNSTTKHHPHHRKNRSQSFGLLSLNNYENENESSVILESNQLFKVDSPIMNKKVEEMLNTFTVELAHTAYMSISRLNSGVYVDSILPNSELIQQMCSQFEKNQANTSLKFSVPKITNKNKVSSTIISPSSQKVDSTFLSSQYDGGLGASYGASFDDKATLVGNQLTNKKMSVLAANNNGIKFSELDLKENKSKIDTTRFLNNNWLAYLENEIRFNDKSAQFDFKHINLVTLSGHTSTVKCIKALDNETSIITGSKDKTVKLWSLTNHGGSTGSSKYDYPL
jgi:hypothetical protein